MPGAEYTKFKYAVIAVSIISALISGHCFCDEMIYYIKTLNELRMLCCVLAFVHVSVSVMLCVGVILRKPWLMLPWLICLPLTILDYVLFTIRMMNSGWGSILALLVSMSMWYATFHLYMVYRKPSTLRQARTQMAAYGGIDESGQNS